MADGQGNQNAEKRSEIPDPFIELSADVANVLRCRTQARSLCITSDGSSSVTKALMTIFSDL